MVGFLRIADPEHLFFLYTNILHLEPLSSTLGTRPLFVSSGVPDREGDRAERRYQHENPKNYSSTGHLLDVEVLRLGVMDDDRRG